MLLLSQYVFGHPVVYQKVSTCLERVDLQKLKRNDIPKGKGNKSEIVFYSSYMKVAKD